MKAPVAFLALLVSACSNPAPTPQPTDAIAPTASPTSSTSGYTDAEQAELLTENVGVVCDARPQPEWCRGFFELTVKDGWVTVTTPLTVASAEFADPMCRGIAALAFGDDDESLGITNVRILDHQGEAMIDCDVLAASPTSVQPTTLTTLNVATDRRGG